MTEYWQLDEHCKMYMEFAGGADAKALIAQFQEFVPAGERVLELGMGPGKDLMLLRENYTVVGSDVSAFFVERHRQLHPEVAVCQLDARTLEGFPPEGMQKPQAIYSNKVLIHLTREEFGASLARQAEVVCPGGWLFHSLWYGEKVEDFQGLLFVQHTRESVVQSLPPTLRLAAYGRYTEMEEDDSCWVLLQVVGESEGEGAATDARGAGGALVVADAKGVVGALHAAQKTARVGVEAPRSSADASEVVRESARADARAGGKAAGVSSCRGEVQEEDHVAARDIPRGAGAAGFSKKYWDDNYDHPETMDGIFNAREHMVYLKALFDSEYVEIGSIADFGFGLGHLLHEALNVFFPHTAFGLEPSEYAFSRFTGGFTRPIESMEVSFAQLDLLTWARDDAYEASVFDLGLCNSVFQYLTDEELEVVLPAMARRMKYLYLAVPTGWELAHQAKQLNFDDRYAFGRSEEEYLRMLRPHFTIVSRRVLESKIHFDLQNSMFQEPLFRF